METYFIFYVAKIKYQRKQLRTLNIELQLSIQSFVNIKKKLPVLYV